MDSIVERRKIRGVRPSSRVPRATDPAGIDFLARQQVIEGAQAVPDGVARQAVAYQKALNSKHSVLGRGTYDLRFAEVFIIELHALALADCVPGERHVAPASQRNQYLLPDRVRLCARFMPERKQDAWKGSLASFGQIEVGRHIETGLAFENHLFDPVIVLLDYADDTRIEGRALGKPAQGLEHTLADVPLASGDIRRAREARDCAASFGKRFRRPGLEIGRQHATVTLAVRKASQEVQLVRRLARERTEGTQHDERQDRYRGGAEPESQPVGSKHGSQGT